MMRASCFFSDTMGSGEHPVAAIANATKHAEDRRQEADQ
jgi:hypothetical protein